MGRVEICHVADVSMMPAEQCEARVQCRNGNVREGQVGQASHGAIPDPRDGAGAYSNSPRVAPTIVIQVHAAAVVISAVLTLLWHTGVGAVRCEHGEDRGSREDPRQSASVRCPHPARRPSAEAPPGCNIPRASTHEPAVS
eukprot:2889028-Rhodomonas_salina.6